MGSPLLEIPSELQVRILSNLVTHDFEHILNILCTCKKLHEIALPLSVATFEVHTPNEPDNDDLPMRIRLFKFLRYVTITKPGLASHVKTLVLERWLLDRYQEPIGSLGPTGEDMIVYKQLIRRVAVSHFEPATVRYTIARWSSDLQAGMPDAIFALLLVVCTGLKELCFPEPRERDDRLDDGTLEVLNYSHLQYVLRVATETDPSIEGEPSHPAPLSLLERVYHEGVRDYGYDNWLCHALPFLQLPHLRTYECLYGNILEEEAIFPAFLVPSSSTVRDLVFRSSCISKNSLGIMLAAAKSLRSFEYMRGLSDNDSHYKAAMPRDIIEAIQSHAAGLEHLTLDLNDDSYRRSWLDKPDRIFMGDKLQQMANLKSLVIGMLPLTGIIDSEPSLSQLGAPAETGQGYTKVQETRRLVECLPESLERLEILCCGTGILGEAQELLDIISLGLRFEHLTFVRFIFNYETTDRRLVHLTCRSSSLRVETAFQTKSHRDFDLAQCWTHETSPCSRLHPPTSNYYEDWHKYRYTGEMTIEELFSNM
ncbi:unnamed protein product [Clonostachys rosea f. rosea IK726]|uniref:Uncharacterized protein n=1 Tax=Clonostachys rosea f. rosea IK726 TaxID=1349383 RepID=A0ACA9USM3_BIOOC|nr:unnamed protein product [Clonostachys rosea f. rosea IK726]